VNDGKTFSYINPYTGPFAAPAGERFCCDQVTVYDPRRHAIFYLQQYYGSNTTVNWYDRAINPCTPWSDTNPYTSNVLLETSGPSGDTVMWLRNGAGAQLEYDDDSGSGYFSRIDRLCGVDALPVDGNGQADALSDGILTIRYEFGFTGNTLINGAVGLGCTRCTALEIEGYLLSLMP
jgi:hypothetical protein